MQKVVGSNPISRFPKGLHLQVFFVLLGVVIRHLRPGVRPGDAEVEQQLGDRLGGHQGAPVGVDRVGDPVHTHGRGRGVW
jgi:hypothetical protein